MDLVRGCAWGAFHGVLQEGLLQGRPPSSLFCTEEQFLPTRMLSNKGVELPVKLDAWLCVAWQCFLKGL